MAAVNALRFRFTVDDYYRMAEAGILHEDDRVELIEGEIVHMAPIGPRHAASVERLAEALRRALPAATMSIRTQNPLRLSRESEPQPDVVVVRHRDDFYADAHPVPEDVLLVVEVADSSLVFDRETKLPLYAAAGVPEVWLLDLTTDRLEVFLGPSASGYESRATFSRGDRVAPRSAPDARVEIARLLA